MDTIVAGGVATAASFTQYHRENHSIYTWMTEAKWGNNPCSGYLLKAWQEAYKENEKCRPFHNLRGIEEAIARFIGNGARTRC